VVPGAAPGTTSSLPLASEDWAMLASHSAVQDINSIRLLLVAGAILIVLFWRTVIKLLLLVMLIVAILLLTSGAVAFIEGFHHLSM
jgi:hypothetical protein